MSPDFQEKLIVAVAGPLIAAVVGTLIIGLIVAWVTRRAQDRRSNYELRHELIAQMTLTANEFYFTIRLYARARDEALGEGLTAKEMGPVLHQQYRATRPMGYALESRLRAYFASESVASAWHAALDLLTVQYYKETGQATDSILNQHGGVEHSGYTAEELRETESVYKPFRAKLLVATTAVLSEKTGRSEESGELRASNQSSGIVRLPVSSTAPSTTSACSS